VVSYIISFTGYKKDRIHVEWAAIDANSLERVKLAPSVPLSTQNPENGVASDVEADADTDRGRGRIEFAVPLEGDCIFVRVFAYDTDYNRLDYGDTDPFHRSDAAKTCGVPEPTAVGTKASSEDSG
jgi:hypothetical protein